MASVANHLLQHFSTLTLIPHWLFLENFKEFQRTWNEINVLEIFPLLLSEVVWLVML